MIDLENEEVSRTLREHIRKAFPEYSFRETNWKVPAAMPLLRRLSVLEGMPRRASDGWLYHSIGAWQATKAEGYGIELFELAPYQSEDHVELIAMAANFHADTRYRLGPGRVVSIGRPWVPTSALSSLLVSRPYVIDSSYEYCMIRDFPIQLLWLLPVREAEAKLAATGGLEELETRLESGGVNFLDPNRSSVV